MSYPGGGDRDRSRSRDGHSGGGRGGDDFRGNPPRGGYGGGRGGGRGGGGRGGGGGGWSPAMNRPRDDYRIVTNIFPIMIDQTKAYSEIVQYRIETEPLVWKTIGQRDESGDFVPELDENGQKKKRLEAMDGDRRDRWQSGLDRGISMQQEQALKKLTEMLREEAKIFVVRQCRIIFFCNAVFILLSFANLIIKFIHSFIPSLSLSLSLFQTDGVGTGYAPVPIFDETSREYSVKVPKPSDYLLQSEDQIKYSWYKMVLIETNRISLDVLANASTTARQITSGGTGEETMEMVKDKANALSQITQLFNSILKQFMTANFITHRNNRNVFYFKDEVQRVILEDKIFHPYFKSVSIDQWRYHYYCYTSTYPGTTHQQQLIRFSF
jgi:hypothetical protein